MKKLIVLLLFAFVFIGCETTTQDQDIVPLSTANAKVGVAETDAIALAQKTMTAAVIARRGESADVIRKRLIAQMAVLDADKKYAPNRDEIAIRNTEIEVIINYCVATFKENPKTQAIFRATDGYFGYINVFPKDRTELKGIACDKCKENGIVIRINQPKSPNSMAKCGPIGAWLSAILAN